MTQAICITELSKVYKGKRFRSVHALSEISLAINPGQVFGFLGPNGAGKSTTIKILMGLVRASAGQASLCGIPVHLAESRSNVGYLPENPVFYDFLTGREYLAYVGKSFSLKSAFLKESISNVLKKVQLDHAADRSIRGYSKGMLQRLGLAQALVHDPDLYILDEPMSGLDPMGRNLVKEIIAQLKYAGKTVFFSSHIISDVELVCDRVGIIVGGKILTEMSVGSILEKGIEGYRIRVRGQNLKILSSFEVENISEKSCEIFVPKERLNRTVYDLTQNNCEIEFIDMRRKSLESLFIDIVGKGSL